jgi:hypothetical protein
MSRENRTLFIGEPAEFEDELVEGHQGFRGHFTHETESP